MLSARRRLDAQTPGHPINSRGLAPRPATPHEIFFDPAAFNAGYAGRVLVQQRQGRLGVNNIIYIVGLVVVVIAVLSFFGLR